VEGDADWRQSPHLVNVPYSVKTVPTAQCHVFTHAHFVTYDQTRFDATGDVGTFVMHRNALRQFEVRKVLVSN
jgi:hypothetical protein